MTQSSKNYWAWMMKMFSYDLSPDLIKKAKTMKKKDKILARILLRKIKEITSRDNKTIDSYKNLKSPMQMFKRVHLTDNYILLFRVFKKENHIRFEDVLHWDNAY